MADAATKTNKVIFYHKPTCPFCKMALYLLESNGIKESEIKMINVKEDNNALKEMHKKYGKTVPQIIINGTHVGGCDDLMDALDEGKFERFVDGSLDQVE